MKNLLSTDRYEYVGQKPMTFTNAKKQVLKLVKGTVFWYQVVGRREFISEYKYGEGPVFQLSEQQIEKLSPVVNAVDSPEFVKAHKLKIKKFISGHAEELMLHMRNGFKTVTRGRTDDSTSHIRSEHKDGSIVVYTSVDLGGEKKHGRIVKTQMRFDENWNNFQLAILMTNDQAEDKKNVLNSKFVEDMIALVERLKKFWSKKYGIRFEAAYFGSAVIGGGIHNGPIMYWNSKILM